MGLINQTTPQIQLREAELFTKIVKSIEFTQVNQCDIYNAFDFTVMYKEVSIAIELKQRYNASTTYTSEFIEVDKINNMIRTSKLPAKDCCPFEPNPMLCYISTYTDNTFRIFRVENIVRCNIVERLAPDYTQFGSTPTYITKQFYNVDYSYGKLYHFE